MTRHHRTCRMQPFLLAAGTIFVIAYGCSNNGDENHRGETDAAAHADASHLDVTADTDQGTASSDATSEDTATTVDTASPVDAGDADTGSVPQDPDPSCDGGEGDGALPDVTIASAVTTPHPTLHNITVEWAIEGDENLNGEVRVRYRKEGARFWNRAMELRRIPAGETRGIAWANRHSGSIFDLDPGERYEIELWLVDPDGGCRIESTVVQTRPVPTAMAGAPVKRVTPATLSATLADAEPGDIIDLGAGTYDSFTIGVDGEPQRELVIRSSSGAVVNGTVDASDREYVQIIGLTANRIRFDRSRRVSIMSNVVEVTSQFEGIGAWNRAEDSYIADNVVTGPTEWNEAALGVSGANLGDCILVTGPGHVVAHNKITGCRDNISFIDGGSGEDQYSIDVIGNDIYIGADDGIEADYCEHNCRIMRNRMTNVFIAMSSQPALGGPTYFIRNVVYSNLYLATFKLHSDSIGNVLLHNTAVKMGDAFGITPGVPHTRTYARNNLFIGGEDGTFGGYSNGSGRIVFLPDDVDGDYDYDGLGSAVGNYSGRIGDTNFADFGELRAATTYKNAVQVGLDVFAEPLSIPSTPFPGYSAVDFSLRSGGAAIDAAEVIANVNDQYSGAAPDLGARELGETPPVYGPR